MVLLRNNPGQPSASAKAGLSPEQMQQIFPLAAVALVACAPQPVVVAPSSSAPVPLTAPSGTAVGTTATTAGPPCVWEGATFESLDNCWPRWAVPERGSKLDQEVSEALTRLAEDLSIPDDAQLRRFKCRGENAVDGGTPEGPLDICVADLVDVSAGATARGNRWRQPKDAIALVARLAAEHGRAPYVRHDKREPDGHVQFAPEKLITPFRCEVGPASFKAVANEGDSHEVLRVFMRCPDARGRGTIRSR